MGRRPRGVRGATGRLGARLPDDHFYRIDNGDTLVYNSGMVQGFPNTAYYFSTMNGALTEFKADIDSRAGWSGFAYDGFDDRAMPTSLVGAEYYLANSGDTSNVPYGFDEYLRDREAVAYKNRYALPLGFVYESTIQRSDLERLDPVDRPGAMLQGAVVDDADVGLATRITPTAEAVEVPYSVVAEEGARFDRSAGTITRFRRGSRIVLSVPPVPNAEIYVELKDIKNVGPSKTVGERRLSLDSTRRRAERRVGRLAELGVHHHLGRSRVQARELEVTAVSLLLGEPLAARESGVSAQRPADHHHQSRAGRQAHLRVAQGARAAHGAVSGARGQASGRRDARHQHHRERGVGNRLLRQARHPLLEHPVQQRLDRQS